MSSIPIVGKVFKAIKKNKILSAIVVAAVVYFTVGAAMEYFSASGATTAAAGGSMAATTTASTTAATAAGATGAASTGTALTAGTATTATAAAGAEVGIAGITGAGGAGTGLAAAETAGAATSVFGTALPAVAPAVPTGGGMLGWMAKNPMATMMLGQGVAGAAGSYEEGKAQEAMIAQRERERKDRGLFGFDYEGQPAGVISSAMQQPEVAQQQVQAAQAPIVAGQQIAAPGTMPQQIPIQRKDLPKLNQAGQIALG